MSVHRATLAHRISRQPSPWNVRYRWARWWWKI